MTKKQERKEKDIRVKKWIEILHAQNEALSRRLVLLEKKAGVLSVRRD